MSLAITTDFINFEYKYMVNTPDDFFDSHGVYTGSSIIIDNKVHCLYTGNVRNEDWSISEYVIKCEYGLKTNKFINKKNLFSNLDYTNYTGHFRDPCIFEYKNKYYFILGAQRKDIVDTILLFELDGNLENPKLIKEFK